jgi:hypothetical protein
VSCLNSGTGGVSLLKQKKNSVADKGVVSNGAGFTIHKPESCDGCLKIGLSFSGDMLLSEALTVNSVVLGLLSEAWIVPTKACVGHVVLSYGVL